VGSSAYRLTSKQLLAWVDANTILTQIPGDVPPPNELIASTPNKQQRKLEVAHQYLNLLVAFEHCNIHIRYNTVRQGQEGADLRYVISVSRGLYTVRLHFNEFQVTSVKSRKFAVSINNVILSSSYDIFKVRPRAV